jgi:hypothetical protein
MSAMEIEYLIKGLEKDSKSCDEMIEYVLKSKVKGKTLERVKEACFFLSKMSKHYKKSEEFYYYLSAFILHARTIPWVMRKEYCKVTGWDQWYKSSENIMWKGKEDFFRKITKLRNDAEKEGKLGARALCTVTINKEQIEIFMKSKGLKPEDFTEWTRDNYEGKWLELKALDKNEANKDKLLIAKMDEVRLELDGFPEKDVLVICKTYLLLVLETVFGCITKFGIPDS